MNYVLLYIQPNCWDKQCCKPVVGGWGAYIAGSWDYASNPRHATAYSDINAAHRQAIHHTSGTNPSLYHTLVEELSL